MQEYILMSIKTKYANQIFEGSKLYEYRRKSIGSKNIGKIIFIYFVLPIVKNISQKVGVSILYIYALPYEDLINHYKTYGFVRLPKNEEIFLHKRIKPRYDKSCIFMYQKL